MSETVYIALITGGTALLAQILVQWLTRHREERIEALKWQRQQDAEAKAARDRSWRVVLQNLLLARERIELVLVDLQAPGSVASVPGSGAADAARAAYGEALLCSVALRPKALAFYLATAKLQIALDSKRDFDEQAVQELVKAWVITREVLEEALAQHAQ